MTKVKFQYYVGRSFAYLVFPFIKATGFRFSKKWRGQWVIDHVAANLLADGIKPNPMKF